MKIDFKLTQLNIVILLALFCIAGVKSLIAEKVIIAPQLYKEIAQRFAAEKYNGIINDGIPYFSLNDEIVSWVFTVYRGAGSFPSHDEIKDSVFVAWESRLQSEAQYQAALDAGDEAGAEYARKLIEKYWANMRNGKNFVIKFVMTDSTGAFIEFSSHYRGRKARQAIPAPAFTAASAVRYLSTVDPQKTKNGLKII